MSKGEVSEPKKRSEFLVRVYLIEEYWVEAIDKDEAIAIVNMDGNPRNVITVKQVAKKLNRKQ